MYHLLQENMNLFNCVSIKKSAFCFANRTIAKFYIYVSIKNILDIYKPSLYSYMEK